MFSPEKEEWQRAVEKEYSALLKNKTRILSELPEDKKPKGSRWVFKVKRKDDGSIEKFKARFVARGFGSDYSETLPPTAKLTTLRFCLSLAAEMGLLFSNSMFVPPS